MRIIRDDLWFCVDCLFLAVNDDPTGIDSDARVAECYAGLHKLGSHLVPDFDCDSGDGHDEFSSCGCDCCGSPLAGEMHRFAILGES